MRERWEGERFGTIESASTDRNLNRRQRKSLDDNQLSLGDETRSLDRVTTPVATPLHDMLTSPLKISNTFLWLCPNMRVAEEIDGCMAEWERGMAWIGLIGIFLGALRPLPLPEVG